MGIIEGGKGIINTSKLNNDEPAAAATGEASREGVKLPLPLDLRKVNFALDVDAETDAIIEDLFTYHQWDRQQQDAGQRVRNALAQAVREIVECVPPCETRTVAIRKLIEARMDCNASITFKGRY